MKSIPDFTDNHLLPPSKGDEKNMDFISPYKCTTLEVCERFATSEIRIEILKGLLAFRKRINEEKITFGFQWLYGSFTERIEIREGRPPRDLDVTTFFQGISNEQKEGFKETFPEFVNFKKSKNRFYVDHTAFDISISADHTFNIVGSLMQLFSHTREWEWKGILRIELNTPEIDEQALEYLNNLKL
ncbi:hypothetical protein [uncultured Kordia sp.]|uniref:DUF6932 family protein n=1 Tax=uncultured Kordia sp. TaxID=507699 RepID=UPI00261418F9|nr:hypothetical protein [uncultured Kordia sp.]